MNSYYFSRDDDNEDCIIVKEVKPREETNARRRIAHPCKTRRRHVITRSTKKRKNMKDEEDRVVSSDLLDRVTTSAISKPGTQKREENVFENLQEQKESLTLKLPSAVRQDFENVARVCEMSEEVELVEFCVSESKDTKSRLPEMPQELETCENLDSPVYEKVGQERKYCKSDISDRLEELGVFETIHAVKYENAEPEGRDSIPDIFEMPHELKVTDTLDAPGYQEMESVMEHGKSDVAEIKPELSLFEALCAREYEYAEPRTGDERSSICDVPPELKVSNTFEPPEYEKLEPSHVAEEREMQSAMEIPKLERLEQRDFTELIDEEDKASENEASTELKERQIVIENIEDLETLRVTSDTTLPGVSMQEEWNVEGERIRVHRETEEDFMEPENRTINGPKVSKYEEEREMQSAMEIPKLERLEQRDFTELIDEEDKASENEVSTELKERQIVIENMEDLETSRVTSNTTLTGVSMQEEWNVEGERIRVHRETEEDFMEPENGTINGPKVSRYEDSQTEMRTVADASNHVEQQKEQRTAREPKISRRGKQQVEKQVTQEPMVSEYDEQQTEKRTLREPKFARHNQPVAETRATRESKVVKLEKEPIERRVTREPKVARHEKRQMEKRTVQERIATKHEKRELKSDTSSQAFKVPRLDLRLEKRRIQSKVIPKQEKQTPTSQAKKIAKEAQPESKRHKKVVSQEQKVSLNLRQPKPKMQEDTSQSFLNRPLPLDFPLLTQSSVLKTESPSSPVKGKCSLKQSTGVFQLRTYFSLSFLLVTIDNYVRVHQAGAV